MLPTVKLGGHEITRLIVGGNPMCGNSHYNEEMSRDMFDWYTTENAKRVLFECERQGINTMQNRGDVWVNRMVHEYRREGDTMQRIVQTASELRDLEGHVRQLADSNVIGIYHHGTRTDSMWLEGRIEEIRPLLGVIREAGVLVGVGTHIPDVIKYCEDEDWEVDFYMACFYNLSRRQRESNLMTGVTAAENPYDDRDREEMCQVIRQVEKPCLAFKILAANRRCESPETVREALAYAFASLKPTDACVVGVFPKYRNQVAENCQHVREILSADGMKPLDSS